MPIVDKAGTYIVAPNAEVSLETAATGAKGLKFKFTTEYVLDNGQWKELTGQHIYYDAYYLKADGTLNGDPDASGVNTVKTLKNVLDWDGDILAVAEGRYQPPSVQLVLAPREHNGKKKLDVQWVNPRNSAGGSSGKKVDLNEVKALAAQFGGQLRAAFGKPTKPSTPPPPRQSAPPVQGGTDDIPFDPQGKF